MIDWPIAELLPHAGDMILIDQVLSFDEEQIQTRLTPAWLGIELMAQSVAAYAGCRARNEGRPVELGFLLGTRKFECNVEHFAQGTELTIHAKRSLDQASARLNVFRPPQAAAYLNESQESSHD